MIVAGGQFNQISRPRGLGFLAYEPSTGEIGGGMDWWDGWLFSDYFWPDYSNFNPMPSEWAGQSGGYQDYSWLDNFDPITGDWIGQSGAFVEPIVTDQKYLPAAPSGNWWDVLVDLFSGIVSPGYQPDFSSGIPPAPTPNLPGYCPVGTYHPIDDPFACVPFPDDPTTPGQTQRKPATPVPGPQTRAGSQPAPKCPSGQIFSQQLNRCIPQCPQGQVFNPNTNKCQAAPKCPQGMQFDQSRGTCVSAAALASAGSGLPWWIWLLIAGVGAAALSDDSKQTSNRRRKH